MKAAVLFASLALTIPAAFAQNQVRPFADTVGYPKNFDVYYLGDLNRTNGTEERAYLPSRHLGYARALTYYFSPPGQKQAAPREVLKMDGVRSMTVHGRYYEKLIINSKVTDILALRLVDGPMELFGYAQPKALPVPIPVPGAAAVRVLPVNAYTKLQWYVRTQGSIVPIKKSQFASQMSNLLSSYPALAREVSAGEEKYRYEDIEAIIKEYNDYVAKAGR